MAEKTLVIVESPAKAKTINKYLGSKYIVEASVGHIKDLNSFRLGVDIKNNFKPMYEIITNKKDIIKKLKSLADNSKDILIATDPDREGEAIAWHIADEVRENNSNIRRVMFNEITKTGIKKGLDNPLNLNENLFMSQQARRVLDRLIGYKVSPFLSKVMLNKTSKSLSAGRVQSVALRLISERDYEIKTFVPIEFWSIIGTFKTPDKKNIKARLVSFDGKNIRNPEGSAAAETQEEKQELEKKLKKFYYIKDEEHADSLSKRILNEEFSISDITKKIEKRNPQPPFTTSMLQQEASKRLGLSNKETMRLAQRLYEGVRFGTEGEIGLITYMRTDSVRISPEAQQAAQEFIKNKFGENYLPDNMPIYKLKSGKVQDAHEAIRPTSLAYLPENVKKEIDKDLAKLYELIFNRFLASQMATAHFEKTTVTIQDKDFIFRATDSIVLFDGFLKLYADTKEDEQIDGKELTGSLPPGLTKGLNLILKDLEKLKYQTKPRPFYNEASLIKELDELGIGRPSTYAAIVSTLLDRKYVLLEKRQFHPTELGIEVNKILVANFPALFNVKFTALMEKELDTVADGKKTYLDIMTQFYAPFSKSLQEAEALNAGPDIKCDKCGGRMVIRVSRKGRFLGCSNYPECDNTMPLPKTEKELEEESEEPQIAEGITCDICGKPMLIRKNRFGSKFYGCIDYPKCKGTKPITSGVKCPKCHEGELSKRFSPKSRRYFYGCTRYPDCDYLSNYEPVPKECPKCQNDYIEIRSRKVDGEWQKYLKCPSCGHELHYEQEA